MKGTPAVDKQGLGSLGRTRIRRASWHPMAHRRCAATQGRAVAGASTCLGPNSSQDILFADTQHPRSPHNTCRHRFSGHSYPCLNIRPKDASCWRPRRSPPMRSPWGTCADCSPDRSTRAHCRGPCSTRSCGCAHTRRGQSRNFRNSHPCGSDASGPTPAAPKTLLGTWAWR